MKCNRNEIRNTNIEIERTSEKTNPKSERHPESALLISSLPRISICGFRVSSRGMTLVEVLITLAIFICVMAAVGFFESNVFNYQRSISGSLQTVQDSQIILKTIAREMRDMAPAANGAYPLVTAGTSTISFFSDANNDGSEDQITYQLIGTKISRAVIPPTGSPPSYSAANQSTTTLVTNVRNSTSTPIFEYYDTNYNGTSSPMASPINLTGVRLVKVNLTLDVDPNRSPLPVTYTSQISLRNIKSNL